MTYAEALAAGYTKGATTYPEGHIPRWAKAEDAVVKTQTRGKYAGQLYVELRCLTPGYIVRQYLVK